MNLGRAVAVTVTDKEPRVALWRSHDRQERHDGHSIALRNAIDEPIDFTVLRRSDDDARHARAK